ncbi:MAG: multifunctional CCA tRNA nucleotidyl transferase/2'3'-cyclic phosphodiesterase/2'nucleotidase/phosphatase, partial [Ramlibacter sp.]|nr:multifunctional CCA tRNA nucleotidyl transferase/2'3'-cyclic phosphodiesterase/2'nucleotidase/phosphatase [Ramlibacter sp.]
MQALRAALSVETAGIAAAARERGAAGPQIGEAIHAARVEAVREALR